MNRDGDDTFWTAVPSRRECRTWLAATLAVFSLLVLVRLDLHPLWDDEANTALFGRTLWATGDLSAFDGDNLIAYRNGAELDPDFHNRRIPPLQYLVEAPFVRDTQSAWWARLPFAVCGIAAIALLLFWLAKLQPSRRTLVLASLAILGNVSFILYCRQARYYGLTFLFSAAIAYAYAHRQRGRSMLALLAVSSIALLASNYLSYAAVAAALGIDYLVAGRKHAAISWKSAGVIVASQIVAIVAIVGTWWPAEPKIGVESTLWWPLARLELLGKTLRDMNACELGIGLLLLATPLLARRARDWVLMRLWLALVISIVTTVIFSPQPVMATADLRYLAFAIPLCMVICVRTLECLPIRSILIVLIGVVAFQTTVMHKVVATAFPTPAYALPMRNTLLQYIGELTNPPPSAYALAIDVLNENAPAGATALVMPDFGTYPLMFHAPHLTYGWQIDTERSRQLQRLGSIYAYGAKAPDWVVVFGGKRLEQTPAAEPLGRLGARYQQVAEFALTGVDMSRPELYWHRFSGVLYWERAPLTIWRKVSP